MSEIKGFPVVLLNGPPGCGKDTAGESLAKLMPSVAVVKFAAPLKRATHELFGLTGLGIDAYEGPAKEQPQPELFGLTPRAAYIRLSERAAKPLFGDDFFGRVMVNQIATVKRAGARLAIITDSGFGGEVVPLINAVGAENVLLLHIYRPGCTFAGDSRSYWTHPDVRHEVVHNTGSVGLFRSKVIARVAAFYREVTGAEAA